MTRAKLRIQVSLLLVFLVILDTVLSIWTIFYPQSWYAFFHAADYVDPQGLLRRTGAVWTAFTLLQLLALFRWEREPWWLVLIAGVRLTEIFSDWTYILVAGGMTFWGGLGLFVSPPSNLLFGWFLVRSYRRVVDDRRDAGAAPR